MKIERIKLIEIIAYISSVLPSTLFIIWMSLSTTLDIGKKLDPYIPHSIPLFAIIGLITSTIWLISRKRNLMAVLLTILNALTLYAITINHIYNGT